MKNRFTIKIFNHNYIFIIFLYIWGFIFLFKIPSIKDVASRLFPYIICILTIVSTTMLLLKTYYHWGKKEDPVDFSGTLSALFMAFLLLVYIGAITTVGYYLATPFYLYISMWILGQKNIKLIFAVSLLTPLAVYLFFDLLLKLQIPKGFFFS